MKPHVVSKGNIRWFFIRFKEWAHNEMKLIIIFNCEWYASNKLIVIGKLLLKKLYKKKVTQIF